MSTLLRFLIGAIGFVYLQGGIVLPLLLVVHGQQTDGTVALIGVGAPLLGIGSVLAGLSVSYTRWSDDDSRRRARRQFAVVLAVQGVGAVLLTAAGLASPGAGWALAAFVLVGFLLDPALLAIGRAALRRDVLTVSGDEWADSTRTLVRRGYRNAAIGFAIGLGIGVALFVLLSVLFGNGRIDLGTVLIALGLGCLGASVAMALGSLQIGRSIREVTGAEFGVARRLARVVIRNKPESLTDDEEGRAGRYAAIVAQWLPFQTVQLALLYTGILFNTALGLTERSGIDPVQLAVGVFVVVVAAVLIPFQLSRARRARRYAVAHGTLAA